MGFDNFCVMLASDNADIENINKNKEKIKPTLFCLFFVSRISKLYNKRNPHAPKSEVIYVNISLCNVISPILG